MRFHNIIAKPSFYRSNRIKKRFEFYKVHMELIKLSNQRKRKNAIIKLKIQDLKKNLDCKIDNELNIYFSSNFEEIEFWTKDYLEINRLLENFSFLPKFKVPVKKIPYNYLPDFSIKNIFNLSNEEEKELKQIYIEIQNKAKIDILDMRENINLTEIVQENDSKVKFSYIRNLFSYEKFEDKIEYIRKYFQNLKKNQFVTEKNLICSKLDKKINKFLRILD